MILSGKKGNLQRRNEEGGREEHRNIIDVQGETYAFVCQARGNF